MKKITVFFAATCCLLLCGTYLIQAEEYKGFFNFTYDESEDRILMEIREPDKEFLYVSSLASGVGANELGLDRGKLSRPKIVKFMRAGNKMLLIQPNYGFRASSTNKDELKAVEDAFAQSVLWGFKIEKEVDGKYIIDLTPFLMQDATGAGGMLPGSYKVDESRSALYLPGIKNFPKNSEFETIITFTGNPSGRVIGSVSPTANAVTLRQHHSFIELPDDNYTPRKYDPRAGFIGIQFKDYAVNIDEPVDQRYIARHRLNKKNPEAKISEPVEPIVYYIDRGAPEPIKTALFEGAEWWNQAFEAAGYKNAFIVKEMPEGADMLDVRYNVIQWVHRSTRGWSYGSSITDPRTGEIIKGHVTLGSLRVRQDFMIARGLLSPYTKDNNQADIAEEMALARIRQLSAHEIGHTIGLAHAYSASMEDRASVMDYPHPYITLNKGEIDLSQAYDDKIGKWDMVAIKYGYQHFPDGTDEDKALDEIIQNSLAEGLYFHADATASGDVHPFSNHWDNGKIPHEELLRLMEIRKIALENFGENTLRDGEPYATLEDILVPVYLLHRYQIAATAKMIGGLNYRYAMKGDDQFITRMIPAEDQWAALNALLKAISPEELEIPEHLLNLIPPKPMGYRRNQAENISGKTGVAFDALSAARTITDMVFERLTNPERIQRILEYNSRDKNLPSPEEVLTHILTQTWEKEKPDQRHGTLARIADNSFLLHLLQLAASPDVSDEVKAITRLKIHELRQFVKDKSVTESNFNSKAHYLYAADLIDSFYNNQDEFIQIKKISPPQGPPIGME